MKKSLLIFSIILTVFLHPALSLDKMKVYVFMAEECPISQYYTKELNYLAVNFAPYVDFIAVFPMKTSTNETIDQFKKKYNFNLKSMLDEKQTISKKFQAKVTPEVILVQNDSVLYRGRIDDAFLSVGSRRKVVKERNLLDAIEKAKTNTKIEKNITEPVGCVITYTED